MGRRDSTIKRTGLDGGVIVFKRGLLQAKGEELRKPYTETHMESRGMKRHGFNKSMINRVPLLCSRIISSGKRGSYPSNPLAFLQA